MERKGTTKTFVLSTKIFVAAQNRGTKRRRFCLNPDHPVAASRPGAFVAGVPAPGGQRPAKKVSLSD